MQSAAATREPMPGTCSKEKRSPPPRGWTSAVTGPIDSCASPTREAWTTCRKLLSGLRALRLPRLDPERLQKRLFGEHFVRVPGGRLIQRTGVHLQRGLRVGEAPLVFAQDLGADLDVDLRMEQHRLTAVGLELLEVVARDD